MSTFTDAQWAMVSQLSRELADEFVADLIAMKLAEPAGRGRVRLTDEGLGCLRALREMPLDRDEEAA